jgi:hypothetical protein
VYLQQGPAPLYSTLSSIQPALLQVDLDDDVGDGVKHKLHVLGVCSAREVGIDLLGVLPSVQVLKLALDVSSGLLIGAGAWCHKTLVILKHFEPEKYIRKSH